MDSAELYLRNYIPTSVGTVKLYMSMSLLGRQYNKQSCIFRGHRTSFLFYALNNFLYISARAPTPIHIYVDIQLYYRPFEISS